VLHVRLHRTIGIYVVNCISAVLGWSIDTFSSTTILHQGAYSLALEMTRELEGGGTDD
jgi:hypothetical protein